MGPISIFTTTIHRQNVCLWEDLIIYLPLQPFLILRNLSLFEPCIPHSFQNITESQILQNKSSGRQVSHSGHVVTIERCFVGSRVVYHCQWCLSVRDREKELEKDWWIERGGGENTKIFLNVILQHVRDDSGFSRQNFGRYGFCRFFA